MKNLRRKAFDDLKKANAEINKLELASGARNEHDGTRTEPQQPRLRRGVHTRPWDHGPSRRPHKAVGSWSAIPVPSQAVKRQKASAQEAAIVAELIKDIIATSHDSKAHRAKLHHLEKGSDVGTSTESLSMRSSLLSSRSQSSEHVAHAHRPSVPELIDQEHDVALTADQAEKAAEAAQLKSEHRDQCKACLDRWSAGARYCVLTECHLHTSASLLSAPEVPRACARLC